jgi:N-acetylmuramoyl-L-alanine amidase
MRAIVLLLAILAGFTFSSSGAVKGLERVTVLGSTYVRLAEWADSNGFKWNWSGKEQPIEVRARGNHIEFNPDSRRSSFDGVTIWLSLPVINRGGVAMISLADLETAVEPLLSPHKDSKPIQTICLDPGHGGKDGGETDNRNLEKTYTLLLGRELAALLKDAGFRVILTRHDDELIDLSERPAIAHRQKADIFVSLHFNSASSPVRGVEVYCMTPSGMNSSQEGGGKGEHAADIGNTQDNMNVLLAWHVQKSITSKLQMEDRGVKRARYEVLRLAHMPAILVEGGFMTNPSDARHIYDTAFRKRLAQAIFDGIVACKDAVEPKEKLAGN